MTIILRRWIVVMMISSCVILPCGMAAWWWLTWPERTLTDVLTCVRERRYAAVSPYVANSAVSLHHDIEIAALESDDAFPADFFTGKRRTVRDIVLARQEFEVG